MSKEAMKLALQALKELVAQTETGLFAVRHDHVAMNDARQAITALREALAEQPAQQEPVATVTSETGADISMSWWHEPALPVGTPLYTTPPQRTWVGLTFEERNKLWREVVGWGDPSHDDEDLMKAIEAKLKEKNT